MERANPAGEREKENKMYGLAEYGISRQHREEIRQEVAAYRLEEKLACANREGRFRLIGDTKWELGRYAGLLKKRLRNIRNTAWREAVARAETGGGGR
jgi:hypothetical protein